MVFQNKKAEIERLEAELRDLQTARENALKAARDAVEKPAGRYRIVWRDFTRERGASSALTASAEDRARWVDGYYVQTWSVSDSDAWGYPTVFWSDEVVVMQAEIDDARKRKPPTAWVEWRSISAAHPTIESAEAWLKSLSATPDEGFVYDEKGDRLPASPKGAIVDEDAERRS